MKKIFIVSILFFVLNSFAQKSVYINNQSSFGVDIGSISTKPSSGTYPQYQSLYTNGGTNLIHLNPGQSYSLVAVLQPTIRFPFYSPTSVPIIANWGKYTSPTTVFNVNSSSLNTIVANSQVFAGMKFHVASTAPYYDGGTILSPPITLDLGGITTITGVGWIAYCSFTGVRTLNAAGTAVLGAEIDISIYDN